MSEDKRHEEEFEFLSRAIVDAIVKSSDVRKAIRKLSESDESYAKSFMVLMLKVQNIAETMEGEKPAKPGLPTEKKMELGKEDFEGELDEEPEEPRKNYVDGKLLSPSEMAFREFLAERFDQDDWLRRNKLIL